MKITKTKLRHIIREELQNILNESAGGPGPFVEHPAEITKIMHDYDVLADTAAQILPLQKKLDELADDAQLSHPDRLNYTSPEMADLQQRIAELAGLAAKPEEFETPVGGWAPR